MLKVRLISRQKRVPLSVTLNKFTYCHGVLTVSKKFQPKNLDTECKLDLDIGYKLTITLNSVLDLDTGCKLNVHKTFGRRPGHLLNVLPTFNSLGERPRTFISYLYYGM